MSGAAVVVSFRAERLVEAAAKIERGSQLAEWVQLGLASLAPRC